MKTETHQAELSIGLLQSGEHDKAGKFRIVLQIGRRRDGKTLSAYIDPGDFARCVAGQASYVALTIEDRAGD